MNLEYALETLRVHHDQLQHLVKALLNAGFEEEARATLDEASGIRYAIDVLEAAMGDSK